MTTKEGIVTKVDITNAWVTTKVTKACKGCAALHVCTSFGDGKKIEVKAINTVSAKIGDRVVISLEGLTYLKISFLFYLFPVLSVILGAVIGESFSIFIDNTASSAIFGFLFFLLAILIIKIIEKRLSKKNKYIPKITKILKQS